MIENLLGIFIITSWVSLLAISIYITVRWGE